ncbi:uncharacterized protein TA08370 [Theileria annulata]|uniref:SfiI-subtelomeric related protein family member n=1 Tax=Theileria annulata TaxID=5874 RepID=Q4U9N9_THEAN|nr:uncharacterized protein TA08370 [Theileria annulata]CAI76464.1 hypothetical protein, conserved [Theileria annulata]|eukprot:XP_953089.1 hypothetical protein, conserved [Theileria annulata]
MKMFSVFSLLFVFLSLRFVNCNVEGFKLRLDEPDENVFKVKTSQFDNIRYKHYTPLKHNYIVSVLDSDYKVWESDGFETCVYSLLAYRKQLPYLLYFQVDSGHTLQHFYYVKELNRWKKIDINNYCNLLKEVKNEVIVNGVFGYNLFNAVRNSMMSVENASEDVPYTQFTSTIGYLAHYVYFKTHKLWSSKAPGERCAAAFCYSHSDQYYMVRLLITNANEESKLETFFNIKGKWVHVHTLDEVHDKKLYVQKPESFKYPNYTFTCKPVDFNKVQTLHTKVDEPDEFESDKSGEPYFDLTDEFYKYKVQYEDTDNTFGFHDHVHSHDYVDRVESACQEPYFDLTSTPDTSHSSDYDDSGEMFDKCVSASGLRSDYTTKLDISIAGINLFTQLRCVDNVFYKVYNPTPDSVLSTVVDCKSEIWKAKSESERCVHVLAPQKEGQHMALYLILEVESEFKTLFFEKINGKWISSNLEKYKKIIASLKENVVNEAITIDLRSKTESSLYSVEYKFGKNPYLLYLPSFGTSCNKLVDGSQTIWESSNAFDRCVAVWSYESWAKPYMVKVLIQFSDGSSDVLSFLNARNQWDLFSSFKRSFANKMPFKKPLDFYNPEYLFNQDITHYTTVNTVTSSESTVETTLVDNTKLVDNTHDSESTKLSENTKLNERDYVNSLTEEFNKMNLNYEHKDSYNMYINSDSNEMKSLDSNTEMHEFKLGSRTEKAVQNAVVDKICNRKLVTQKYKIYYKPISAKDCVHLDISMPVNLNSYEAVSAEFDGRLLLLSYRALPGKYFRAVYDGIDVIFLGNHTTHLCYEFNVYLKNKVFYLADALVRVKNEDVTLHLKKTSNGWEYIDQETFLESVEILKKSSNR